VNSNLKSQVIKRLTALVESECDRDKEEAKNIFRRDGGRFMCVDTAASEIVALLCAEAPASTTKRTRSTTPARGEGE
jgi:hypothetical protein